MSFRTTEMDFYDDGGSLLRETVAAEDIPDFVKSAEVVDSSSPSNLYALVLIEDGNTLKKFATVDAGNAWLSTLYFAKNRHTLPIEAQKIAATNLKGALIHFNIEVPEVIEKLANEAISTNIVDVTGKSAPRISKSRDEDVEFALELNDGTKRYPLNDAESVKTALSYFELNQGQFVPRERREYAVKVASVAHKHGMAVNDAVASYAGTRRAAHAAGHLDLRKEYLLDPSGEAGEALEKLASKGPHLEPAQFADELASFDVKHGLDALWDTALLDPWKSVLAPLEKVAKGAIETTTFQIGNDVVTEGDLMNLKKMRKTLVDNFGASFADQYAKDPVSLFKSMPLPQKKVIASLARDVTNSGAY